MLSDWYFCYCIGADPEQTRTFLSILDVLQNPDRDAVLLDLACNELERGDSWMHIYILPTLLDVLLQPGQPVNFRKNIQRIYFSSIQGLLSEDQGKEYDRLISAFVKQSSELWSIMKGCLRGLAGPNLRTPTGLPYLDMREFAPEILLLVFLRYLIRSDENAVRMVIEELDSSESELRVLLQDALEYHYGRLPLRLAAYILGHLHASEEQWEFRQQLVNTLAAAPGSNIGYEPDLLQTSAEILFPASPSLSEDDRHLLVKKVLEETYAFACIPEHPASLDSGGNPAQACGTLREEDQRTLQLVYWQAVLWELAQEIDPVTTAGELVSQWKMREGPIKNVITFGIPHSVQEGDYGYWKNQLLHLAQLHPLEDRNSDIVLRSNPVSSGGTHNNAFLFVSPALVMNAASLRYPNALTGAIRYPAVTRQPALVRLLAASITSIRLLQKLDRSHEAERLVLAALLVHSSDVLTLSYMCPQKDDRSAPRNDWLRGYNRKGSEKIQNRLSMPLTGLALFVESQVRAAGKGEYTSIEPELFVRLLHETCPAPRCNFFISFQRLVLPQVLVHWIVEAFSGALPGNGPARWFDLLPEVIENYPYRDYRDKAYDRFGREEAALLTRFFLPGRWNPDLYDDLNWQTAKHVYHKQEQASQWNVRSRRLLLTAKLPPDQWKPDWEEPVRELQIERATERLASLKYGDGPSPDEDVWLADWNNAISRVIVHADLDRFTRLRLLEFMKDPFLADRPDEQELIILTLLEHGSVYDQYILLQQVFGWRGDTGFGTGMANNVLQGEGPQVQDSLLAGSDLSIQIRCSVLRAIYRMVELGDVDREQRLSPQSPYLQRHVLENQNLLQEFIHWVACPPGRETGPDHECPSGENDVAYGNEPGLLAEELFTLRNDELDRLIDRGMRMHIRDVEMKGDRKIIHATDLPAFPLLYQGIGFNPDHMYARFFYQDLDVSSENLTNLFELPGADEVKAFIEKLGKQPVSVVAVVVDRSGDQYTFDFGARFTRSHPGKNLELAVGDIVSLPIFLSANGKVEVYSRGRIEKVPPRLAAGSVTYLELQQKKEGKNLHIQLFDYRNDVWHRVSKLVWLPDGSYCYSQQSEGSRKVLAVKEAGSENPWRPFERSFTDLLLAFSFPEEEEQITLAFIDHTLDRFGQVCWRFARIPGENYLLSPFDFVAGAAEQLAERLDSHDDSHGLLVTVERTHSNGKARLRLAEEASGERLEHHDHLEVPFDERNLDWKHVFDDQEDVDWRAYFEGGSWWIHLEDQGKQVKGYPSHLLVRWEGNKPYRDNSPVLCNDPRLVDELDVVKASWEKTFDIFPDQGDWESFWHRWYSLKKGDIISIVGTHGSITPNGQFLGRTPDSSIVHVDAESLDMLPLNSSIIVPEERLACVTRVLENRSVAIQPDWEESMPPLETASECAGILISVPVERSANAHCQVLLNIGDRLWQGRVTLLSPSPEKWQNGTILRGVRGPSGWAFTAHPRLVVTRALWVMDEYMPNQQVTFLGVVSHDSKWFALGQVSPGHITNLPYTANTTPHLSEGRHPDFRGGILKGTRCENAAKDPDFRARLELGKKGVLCGFPARPSENGSIEFDSAGIRISPISYQGITYYDITRRLAFTSVHSKNTRTEQNERNRKRFEEYIQSEPRPDLPCRYLNNMVSFDGRFFVPLDTEMTRWTDQLPVAPSEGAFIDTLPYQPNGLVQLVPKEEGGYLASFKRVKHLSVDQLYLELGSFEPGKIFTPSEKLHFVGEETSNPIDASEVYSEVSYRFEWGYGKTVLIPKSRLLYKENSIDTAEFVLFYGDSLSRVSFKEVELAEQSHDEGKAEFDPPTLLRYCLNIADISLTMEHRLYQQRGKKIIHRLHLAIKGKEIVVSRVEGFDDESQNFIRDFPLRAQAQLTEASLVRLHARMDRAPKDWVILARMQKEEFERTRGRSVLFSHVRLALPPRFQESPTDGSSTKVNPQPAQPPEAQDFLQWDEVVFLQIKDLMKNIRNDIGIRLTKPDTLMAEDVDQGLARNLIVLRRQFSVRQDLLWRVSEDEEFFNKRLGGREVLVRLTEPKETSSAQVFLTMLHGISRSERVLERAIESNNGSLFATVLDIYREANEGVLALEIKPGIFIRIPFSRLEQFTGPLSQRDTIRVENRPGGHFAVTRISPSQERYVPVGLRPALALPKNTLINQSIIDSMDVLDAATWLRNEFSFTIGGLPEIVAMPGTYLEGRWGKPEAGLFVKLMEKPYYRKTVAVGIDHHRKTPRLSPQIPPGWIAGRLLVETKTIQPPRLLSLDEDTQEYSTTIEWRWSSFSDEPADKIRNRIDRSTWRYHDHQTGHWVFQEEKVEVAPREFLSNQRLSIGPVFVRTGQPVLRYDPDDFRRVGFPVQELIQQLRTRNRQSYTVAGASDLGGIWIELAPGRLAEVPGQMIMWQSTRGYESLASLAWELFAAGDQVEFELGSTDPLAPDQIILRDWKPSIRHMFHGRRCYLPVQKFDPENGGLVLGADPFRLTLPIHEFETGRSLVCLDQENNLCSTGDAAPVKGDVIFLGLEGSGENPRVTCLGFPGWQPSFLDIEIDGAQVNFRYELFTPARQARMIQAAMGALPVTVENVDPRKKTISFSMRNQVALKKDIKGKLIPVKILGVPFPQEGTVLLQSGTILWKARLEEMISGLPTTANIRARVAEKLPGIDGYLWMRFDGTAEQRTFAMLPDNGPNGEILVNVLYGVQGGSGAGDVNSNGMVCQSPASRMLYWLPETHMGWFTQDIDSWEKMMVKCPEISRLRVRVVSRTGKSPFISAIHTERARSELATANVGKEIIIKVLLPLEAPVRPGTRCFLVRSFNSGIMMLLETIHPADPPREFTAEVIRRTTRAAHQIVLAPLNERPPTLDLPAWMVSPDHDHQAEEYVRMLEKARYIRSQAGLMEAVPHPSLASGLEGNSETSYQLPEKLEVNDLIDLYFYVRSLEKKSTEVRMIGRELLRWKNDHIDARELDAIEGIACVLTLNEVGEIKAAEELLENISRRSLRSMHCEVLASTWQESATWNMRRDNLGRRLAEIRDRVSGKRTGRGTDRFEQQKENINLLATFCRAVDVRHVTDLRPASVGLSMALGRLDMNDIEGLRNSTEFTIRLATLLHTSARKGYGEAAANKYRLERILIRLIDTRQHLVLLDPFTLEWDDGSGLND